MRIFVTGATGFIGTELVKELTDAGHQVRGLTRSDKGAEQLEAVGAEAHYGELEDLDSLRRGAADAYGVIHLAFNHDFSQFQKNVEVDRKPTWTESRRRRIAPLPPGTLARRPRRQCVA